MKKYKEFEPGDRYIYDVLLSTGKGFAQVDTRNDAWYYGTWASPFCLVIFSYVEGDCYTTVCESEEEFIEELRRIKEWNREDFRGVDPGFNPELKKRFEDLGLGDLLH